MHRQLRSLTILDGLMQNAGVRFQQTFADEPLLERLRLMPRDDLVDPDVRAKCNLLYRQWAAAYKNTPGMASIATLYKQLPRTKKPQPSQSKVVRETEAQAAEDQESPPTSPVTSTRSAASSSTTASLAQWSPQRPVTLDKTEKSSSLFKTSKGKKGKRKPFNLEKEKAQVTETIANANIAATNLYNALKLINREHQRVSENAECKNRFETCKHLRRQILRYIQLIESEKYIGSLLSANDELVKSLMAYEFMDKSIDDDSDSDPEYESAKLARRTSGQRDAEEAFARLSINKVAAAPVKLARPTAMAMPPPVSGAATDGKQKLPDPENDGDDFEEDEDDPFADRNAVKTPHIEKDGLTWYVFKPAELHDFNCFS